MLSVKSIPLQQSGTLNKLTSDYVSKKNTLRKFYEEFPDRDGFKNWIEKHKYQSTDRAELSDILLKQAGSVKNSSEESLAAIEKLKSKNTYTVTTGHQLCLFTGPLYFLYKIYSTIVLSDKLKKQFPENDFVPVYWMASEDHDFDEINHFSVEGDRITWNSKQQGAVGEFETSELKNILPDIKNALGVSATSNVLQSLFEKAYLGHADLAKATRYLVNELFGKHGLVTIDGNDHRFKIQFAKEFQDDILKQKYFPLVSKSAEELAQLGYHTQVNAREINCFYLEKGLRARIEKQADVFKVTGTELTFTASQLKEMLDQKPESISPNVVLRPMYQQKILPNIAYVGGPGELAYWLEFREMFLQAEIPFPVLVPRSSVTIIPASAGKKINKLGLELSDLSKSENELILELQKKTHGIFSLENEEENVKQLFKNIAERASAVDKTLDMKVNADLQRTLNALESISGKANRAIRRKMDEQKNNLNQLRVEILPGGVPQERHENFSSFYLRWQKDFLDLLSKTCNPLELKQYFIIEEA